MTLRPECGSAGLAALVVDALVVAGLVPAEEAGRAIRVAAEELSDRKALGDYWCEACLFRQHPIYPAVDSDAG